MKYDPKVFIGILKHVEKIINFNIVGLLRESGEQSSIDMFKFKINEHIEAESLKRKPDVDCTYFDFDGFARDWLSPNKQDTIDKFGHRSLADIVKDFFCNIKLSGSFNKKLLNIMNDIQKNEKSLSPQESTLLFFNEINNPKYQIAFVNFIKFGRSIYKFNQINQMGLQQTAKMMAPCFTRLILGSSASPDEVRNSSVVFQRILETCLPLSHEKFDILVSVDKKWVTTKALKHEMIGKIFGEGLCEKLAEVVQEYTKAIAFHDLSQITGSSSPSSIESSETSTSGSSVLLFSTIDAVKSAELFEHVKVGNVSALKAYFASCLNALEIVNSIKTIFNRSLLHTAVLFQQPEVVTFLNQMGADVHALDKHQRTPLHYAAAWKQFGRSFDKNTLIALLEFKGAALSAKLKKDSEGFTAIKKAAFNEEKEFAAYVIQARQESKNDTFKAVI